MKATNSGGLVVDGSVRDLEGLALIPMPAFFRHAHPTAISQVMPTGINVPVRIGEVTVMPGIWSSAIGRRLFIPPALVDEVLDKADEMHIHDEWTKRKFDEGKYKSSEIYGSPKDAALKKEYEGYLKKRLAGDSSQVGSARLAIVALTLGIAGTRYSIRRRGASALVQQALPGVRPVFCVRIGRAAESIEDGRAPLLAPANRCPTRRRVDSRTRVPKLL